MSDMENEIEVYRKWKTEQAAYAANNDEANFFSRMRVRKHSLWGATVDDYKQLFADSLIHIDQFLESHSHNGGAGVKIIDAGAGAGFALTEIHEKLPQAECIAIDIKNVANFYRNDLSGQGDGDGKNAIQRVQGSYLELSDTFSFQETGGVDLILAARSFFPILDDRSSTSHLAQHKILKEFAACLKPGGLALVTMEMTTENLLQMESLERYMAKRGFSLAFREIDSTTQRKFVITPSIEENKMMVAVLKRS